MLMIKGYWILLCFSNADYYLIGYLNNFFQSLYTNKEIRKESKNIGKT